MGKTEWTMTAIFTAIGTIFTIIAILVESVVAKWIWGVLAAAVFIFTIYAIIDSIVKSRRKPKDLADLLIQYMEQESKKPGFKEDFAKRESWDSGILKSAHLPTSNLAIHKLGTTNFPSDT